MKLICHKNFGPNNDLLFFLFHVDNREICHRDVKLDNILVFRSDFSRVKVNNFFKYFLRIIKMNSQNSCSYAISVSRRRWTRWCSGGTSGFLTPLPKLYKPKLMRLISEWNRNWNSDDSYEFLEDKTFMWYENFILGLTLLMIYGNSES